MELHIQQLILNNPLKQYVTAATPSYIYHHNGVEVDVDGVTYNVSNTQLRAIRGILDAAIRVSGN